MSSLVVPSPKEWVDSMTLAGFGMRLEPLELRHAPGLHAAATPDLFIHTPQAPKEWSVQGFEADIEKLAALADVVGFAIVADGEIVGRSTYMEIRPKDRGLEIGRTWISRRCQGTWVNPALKLLFIEHAIERMQAARVQLTTGLSNRHSQRAIEKLGAVKEGVLRQNRILPNGTLRDTVVYSILSTEWPVVRAGLAKRLCEFGRERDRHRAK